ncbi:unnamed protein product, partial [Nesidiocoris tenuis]
MTCKRSCHYLPALAIEASERSEQQLPLRCVPDKIGQKKRVKLSSNYGERGKIN